MSTGANRLTRWAQAIPTFSPEELLYNTIFQRMKRNNSQTATWSQSGYRLR